jgi:nucleoid DNA-binding protein
MPKKSKYTKSALAADLAEAADVSRSQALKILNALAEIAVKELKSAGEFTVPHVAKLMVKEKPATSAGTREMFGKTVVVKARPKRKVVKARILSGVRAHFK